MAAQTHHNTFESGYLQNGLVYFDSDGDLSFDLPELTFSEHFDRPVRTFDTIVVSDIHLGNRFCRAHELLVFLKTVSCNRLIINGDIFDDINMKRLNRHHWQILSHLRALTDKENHMEVIWLRGNHDGYSDLISQLLGIEFLHEYCFEWNGKKVMVLHGDIFDQFNVRPSILGQIGGFFYQLGLQIDPQKRRIGRWLKLNSRTYQRNLSRVRQGAEHYARQKGADIIICGHTHFVEECNEHGIRYLNTGCWADDKPSYFVGITQTGLKLLPFL